MDAKLRRQLLSIAATENITLEQARMQAAEADALISEIRDVARRCERQSTMHRTWWLQMAEAIESAS